MAGYCMTLEVYDWIHVQVQASQDADRESILDPLEEKVAVEGLGEVFLHVDRKSATILRKGEQSVTRPSWCS